MESELAEWRRGLGMMRKIRKKHSKGEISGLLAQAAVLSSEGRPQSEIAEQLGISVMTLHRWRKMASSNEGEETCAPLQNGELIQVRALAEQPNATLRDDPNIATLRLENSRLRRLVTDLMLEKMQYLEEKNFLERYRKSVRAKP